MATPGDVPGATGLRRDVAPSGEDRPGARRPTDPIVLALAAAIPEIGLRRAAQATEHSKEEG